jgi:large subunit ribosomal protein L17
MRHRKANRKLNRPSGQRRALLRNLATSLFENGRIITTHARARELKRMADKIVTLAKKGDLHSRRQALRVLYKKETMSDLFASAREKFGDRNGGYTRILKIGYRKGDNASISMVELVD